MKFSFSSTTAKIWMLIILAAAISFSPSFSIGALGSGLEGGVRQIEIRLEDVLLAVILCMWGFSVLKNKKTSFRRPPLFVPILTFLCIGLTSILINILLGYIQPLRASFFFLKEIEFFILYFLTFPFIVNKHNSHTLFNAWMVFIALNTLFIAVQVLFNLKFTYYYGPTLFADRENPFVSGNIFLLFFIMLSNVLLYFYLTKMHGMKKKIIYALLCTAPVIGLFASGSKSAFVGFIFSSAITIALYLLKTGVSITFSRKTILLIVAPALVLLLIFYHIAAPKRLAFDQIFQTISQELNPNLPYSRIAIWSAKFNPVFQSYHGPFLGLGISVLGESHNQFIRVFVETGIVGLIAFVALIIALLTYAWRGFITNQDAWTVSFAAGLFVMTATMILTSMIFESFIYSVKLSEVFWSFAGLSLATLQIAAQKQQTSHVF